MNCELRVTTDMPQGHHCGSGCEPNGRRNLVDRDAKVLSVCGPRGRATPGLEAYQAHKRRVHVLHFDLVRF
jgi:hypothetical protein